VKFYAGIDGGQTTTVAIVADEHGRILGRGTAAAADEVGQDAKSTRLRDAIEGALARAMIEASLAPSAQLEAVVAGISGYDGKVRGQAPRIKAKRVRLVHDAPIAHAGALAGRSGVIAIAGTGSVVYGVARDGRTLTIGGWGYLFGDEGSAFRIERNAINLAMNDQDRDTVTPLWAGACTFFGVRSLRDVQAANASGNLSRDRIAAFTRVALGVDDARVDELLDIGTTALARQVGTAAERLGFGGKFKFALVGGLSESSRYVQAFERARRTLNLQTQVDRAQEEPVMGALRMAMA